MRTNTRTWTATRSAAVVAAGASLIALLGLTGCDESSWHVVSYNCETPHTPVGVYSVTGDEEVTLYWYPAVEEYDHDFVIYRASSLNGTYYEIGHTGHDYFVDRDLRNGRTYYYAVSALNDCGYESDLSREIVHDTPRPEGSGRLLDANGADWRRSGWSFPAYQAVPWDHPDADVYFIWADDVPYLVAADLDTDIQDAGYVDFDVIGWAPDRGWSPTGTVELIPGHVYVAWTRDDHFAKLRVLEVDGDELFFEWAYQEDRGNPELAPRPPRTPSLLSGPRHRGA